MFDNIGAAANMSQDEQFSFSQKESNNKLKRELSGIDFSRVFEGEVSKANENLSRQELSHSTKNKDKEELKGDVAFAVTSALFVQDNGIKLQASDGNSIKKSNSSNRDNVNVTEANPKGVAVEQASNVRPVVNPNQIIDFQKILATEMVGKKLSDFQVGKVIKAHSISTVDIENFYPNIVKHIVTQKNGALRLSLEPKNLGKVDVFFMLDEDKLYISFAASEQTKKILEDSKSKLLDFLQEEPGFEHTQLGFAQYDSREHLAWDQEYNPQLTVEQENSPEYDMLNIISKKDILSGVDSLFSELTVSYLA